MDTVAEMRTLGSNKIWAILLLQKLKTFVNKVVCITSYNIWYFLVFNHKKVTLITEFLCNVFILICYYVKIGAKIDQSQWQKSVTKV